MAKTPMPWQAIEVFSSTSKWNFEMTDAILSPRETRWASEAEAVGLTWLKQVRPRYGLFLCRVCENQQEMRNEHVRINSFKCKFCFRARLIADAHSVNLTWLKQTKSRYGLYQFNKCRHQQEISNGHIRDGGFACKICYENKIKTEAESAGLTWLKQSTVKNGLFRFNLCGHEQEIANHNVRIKCFSCQTCDASWVFRSSSLYIHVIEVQGEQIIKVGISRMVDRRATEYGLPDDAQIVTPLIVPFETGKLASAAETKVLRAFKHAKHPAAKHFFTKSGQTECFRREFLGAILEYCKSLQ